VGLGRVAVERSGQEVEGGYDQALGARLPSIARRMRRDRRPDSRYLWSPSSLAIRHRMTK
jgi:hypothetical protein